MRRILLVANVVAACGAAEAQVVTDMTPERIKEAIAQGGQTCYILKTKVMMDARPAACVETPYSRVAGAAAEAKKKYKTFTEADVTPDMLAPTVSVAVFPQNRLFNRGGMVSVEAVVVMPAKSRDRAAAILPTSAVPLDSSYQNLYGATFEARGVLATFPLSELSESNELRIVYDGHGCSDWKNEPATACRRPIQAEGNEVAALREA